MTNKHIEQLYVEAPKAKNEIYDVGEVTPLEQLRLPHNDYEIYIKREDLGPINAYKWRGAYNSVLNHHRQDKCDTIIAASAGNHAQGVALAARKLNLQAKIYMPLAAPLMKQEAVKRHGGDNVELILAGDTYNEAGDAAKACVRETGNTYIHPFDDIYTMAGQAMIADEIIEQFPSEFDYVFLQIGGGGMAGAVATWLKKHWPKIKVIGVEGEGQASMKTSVEAGKLTTLDSVDTFCDGTAVTRPGDITFEICRDVIDEFITVSNDQVSSAIRQLWEASRIIPEPSGAMGLAGVNKYAQTHASELKGKKILTILCGANMDFSKLSMIASQSAVGTNERRYYHIQLPEREGALLDILEAHFNDLSVSEFLYGKTDENDAWQTIAIDANHQEFEKLESALSADSISFMDISHDEDIRFKIINYNPALFHDPVFMNIEFPERKGALRDLLRSISPVANICYFNYAYSGEAIGRALMGFEFQDADKRQKFFDIIDHSVVKALPVPAQTVARILKV